MLSPPKIIITDVDEDPAVKKERRRKKIAELCALCTILAINWIMVISKSCFVFGMLSGIITTLITIMQYCFFIKAQYSIHFGSKPHSYRGHSVMSPLQSLRWTLGRIAANLRNQMKTTKTITLPQ